MENNTVEAVFQKHYWKNETKNVKNKSSSLLFS